MDNSKKFQMMLDEVIRVEPDGFKDFDRTKNVQAQLQEMMFGTRSWNDTPAGWASSFGHTVNPEIIFTQGITEVYESGSTKYKKQRVELGKRYIKAKKNQEYWKLFKSMEQLWLAFCMAEKYNKTWNGETWT